MLQSIENKTEKKNLLARKYQIELQEELQRLIGTLLIIFRKCG